jgi:hypothetical protein
MESASMRSDAQFAKEINLLAQEVRKLAAAVIDRSLSQRLAEIADETDALVMPRVDQNQTSSDCRKSESFAGG